MNPALHWSEQERLEAANAIANARGNRRGAPPVSNILDVLPPDLRANIVEEANAALDAVARTLPTEMRVWMGVAMAVERASPLPWRWVEVGGSSFVALLDAAGRIVLSTERVAQDDRALIQDGLAAIPRLLAIIRRQQRWIADLHTGTSINCVYCGHNYGPSATTPVAMADVLKAHIAQCPEHPMSGLIAALTAASHALKSYANGNAAPELAASVAEKADEALAAVAAPRPAGGTS